MNGFRRYIRDLGGPVAVALAIISLLTLLAIMVGMVRTARGEPGCPGDAEVAIPAAGLQSRMAATEGGRAWQQESAPVSPAPQGQQTPDAEPTGYVPSATVPPRAVAMRGAAGSPPARPPAPPVGTDHLPDVAKMVQESDHGLGSAVQEQQSAVAGDSRIQDSRSGPARRGRSADGLVERPGGQVPEAFFRALRIVESSDGRNLVGDGGESVGPYQIQRAYWLDGGGKAKDYPRLAYVDAECRKVMLAYWRRYGAATDEERARCHNSGSGWRKKYHLTNDYWRRVQAAMKGSTDGIQGD